ncbi:MAG TPA: hypothetical protein VJ461_05905 [Candidatus Nanoarchaeia archaeon]|nr:hypothetical protein [Candidatus Nanoarchaeia archaeon]
MKTFMQKIREKAKKAIVGAAIAGTLAMPMKAKADMNGSLEAIAGPTKQSTYLRGNAFYQLPGKIGGYTFIELYQGGNGYFGKSMLGREIKGGILAKGEIVHCNEPFSEARLGLEAKLPTPKGTTLQVKALPVCVDKDGKIVPRKVMVGYFADVQLGKGWSISSFGDFNALQGGQWEYGEVSLKKYVWDGVSVAYNPALKASGKLAPIIEHRVTLGIDF